MLKQLNISDAVLFKSLSTSYLNRTPDPDEPIDPDGSGDPEPDAGDGGSQGPPPGSGN